MFTSKSRLTLEEKAALSEPDTVARLEELKAEKESLLLVIERSEAAETRLKKQEAKTQKSLEELSSLKERLKDLDKREEILNIRADNLELLEVMK